MKAYIDYVISFKISDVYQFCMFRSLDKNVNKCLIGKSYTDYLDDPKRKKKTCSRSTKVRIRPL